MKIHFSAALLLMVITSLSVRAEENVASSADATSASAAVALSGSVTPEPPAINHIVYLAQLPSPGELMKGAATQGVTIARIDQTSDRLVVVYEYSGARTVTFAYTLLSAAANYPTKTVASAALPSTSGSAVATTWTTPDQVVYAQPASAPAPQVVYYTEPAPVYYTTRYESYYEPWDFWAPLALGVGIGLIGSHDHGWHGGGHGWHGGGCGYGGHGWHR